MHAPNYFLTNSVEYQLEVDDFPLYPRVLIVYGLHASPGHGNETYQINFNGPQA